MLTPTGLTKYTKREDLFIPLVRAVNAFASMLTRKARVALNTTEPDAEYAEIKQAVLTWHDLNPETSRIKLRETKFDY